jgi:N-hydroxyarylamine O-acetyltransferase
MNEALLERVLARLGLAQRPEPTPQALAVLYAAWCRRVPFDNLRKLIHIAGGEGGPLPGDRAEDFFEAWLAFGTGGTCWAASNALQALLAELGFRASRALGTLLVAPNVPPNHGTVVVSFDDARYLVDPSMLHGSPLRLEREAPAQVDHAAWGVRCEVRAGRWHVRWRPMHMPNDLECSVFRLDEPCAPRHAFAELHERTRRWSPFNYELYVRLNRGARVIGAARGRLVEIDAAGRLAHRAASIEEKVRFLVEELRISEALVRRLPADRPTPPPPGSRKARRLAMESAYAAA